MRKIIHRVFILERFLSVFRILSISVIYQKIHLHNKIHVFYWTTQHKTTSTQTQKRHRNGVWGHRKIFAYDEPYKIGTNQ